LDPLSFRIYSFHLFDDFSLLCRTHFYIFFCLQWSRGSNIGPHAYYPNPSPLDHSWWLTFLHFNLRWFCSILNQPRKDMFFSWMNNVLFSILWFYNSWRSFFYVFKLFLFVSNMCFMSYEFVFKWFLGFWIEIQNFPSFISSYFPCVNRCFKVYKSTPTLDSCFRHQLGTHKSPAINLPLFFLVQINLPLLIHVCCNLKRILFRHIF
jgi:hypothetical protein